MEIPLCQDVPRLVRLAKNFMVRREKPVKSAEKAVRLVFDFYRIPLTNETEVVNELKKDLPTVVRQKKGTTVIVPVNRPRPMISLPLPEVTEGFRNRKDIFG